MMFVPFLGFAGATGAALAGRRGWALGLWAASLVGVLMLFRAHASDVLHLDF